MAGWNGTTVRNARSYWKRRLPLPCSKCRKPVDGRTPWHVDHLQPRALGGNVTDVNNQWPAHAKCNMSDGGKLAGQMKRREHDQPKNIRQWLRIILIPKIMIRKFIATKIIVSF